MRTAENCSSELLVGEIEEFSYRFDFDVKLPRMTSAPGATTPPAEAICETEKNPVGDENDRSRAGLLPLEPEAGLALTINGDGSPLAPPLTDASRAPWLVAGYETACGS